MTETATPAQPSIGRAIAVLVFGAMVIGVGPILVRFAEAGPVSAGFWRLTFALPLLALMSARTPGAFAAPPRAALLAGLFFALDLGFWHSGIALTSVANATVLSNLTPVVVTGFAWIFLKQRPKNLFLVAVAVAVTGTAFMAIGRGGNPGPNPALGDALSTITALWYALYFLAITAARKDSSAPRVMFWSTLVGAPLMLLAALAMGEQILPHSAKGWSAVVGLGLMHVAGQGSIAWALGRLPPATASVTVLVQPVVAGLLGWWLFAETMGPLQALGCGLALGGVILAQRATTQAKP